jgi:hypothetical protein
MREPDDQSQHVDMRSPSRFLNRELSWLAFDRRVLGEVLDTRHPLLERAKFLAIFSSNLDEFFIVRVSGIHDQIDAGATSGSPLVSQLCLFEIQLECLGRPYGYAASEEVPVSGPDAALQRQRQGDCRGIVRIAGNAPSCLFHVLDTHVCRDKRYGGGQPGADLFLELSGCCLSQVSICDELRDPALKLVHGLAPGCSRDQQIKIGMVEQLPATPTQRFGDKCAGINDETHARQKLAYAVSRRLR